MNRRTFIKGSGVAAGTFMIVPSRFVLGQKSSSGNLPPSEEIKFALIGAGRQGIVNMKSMLRTQLCRLVAICDADLNHSLPKKVMKAHPEVPAFTDFRVMFEKMGDQLDSVVIATPDHAHFSAAMLAMSLGKHLYLQKPIAPTFGQCERLMKMAEQSNVVTQMGNQGHSGANYFQFKSWAEAGVIKDITRIDAWFCGDNVLNLRGKPFTDYPSDPVPDGLDWDQWMDGAQMVPYSEQIHPRLWRNWYNLGGGAIGDWGAHIVDTAHRFLKLGMPDKITVVKREGVNNFVFPKASTLRFDFPAREGMPPCELNWYDGVGNTPTIDTEYGNLDTSGQRVPIELKVDSKGKVLYGKDLTFLGGSHGDALRVIPRDRMKEVHASLPKFPSKNSDHFKNFALACRGEEEARSPFSIAAPLCQMLNLGQIAQRLGGELNFDRETNTFANNEEANAFLDPAPRAGWEEYFHMV
ncbi:MAG: Gfo/Idh/MocA family oxidoreductase [Verrucomicrobiota bacterium]